MYLSSKKNYCYIFFDNMDFLFQLDFIQKIY